MIGVARVGVLAGCVTVWVFGQNSYTVKLCLADHVSMNMRDCKLQETGGSLFFLCAHNPSSPSSVTL